MKRIACHHYVAISRSVIFTSIHQACQIYNIYIGLQYNIYAGFLEKDRKESVVFSECLWDVLHEFHFD